MAERGGVTHRFYRETKGIKVSGGQFVKKGSTLTREASKWKAGVNVGGENKTLYALCDGNIYFTKRKGRYLTHKVFSVLNIKEAKDKK